MIQVISYAFALGQYGGEYFNEQLGEKQRQDYAPVSFAFLKAQYEAVANVAILEASQNPHKRIPVIFTQVGGGHSETNILRFVMH